MTKFYPAIILSNISQLGVEVTSEYFMKQFERPFLLGRFQSCMKSQRVSTHRKTPRTAYSLRNSWSWSCLWQLTAKTNLPTVFWAIEKPLKYPVPLVPRQYKRNWPKTEKRQRTTWCRPTHTHTQLPLYRWSVILLLTSPQTINSNVHSISLDNETSTFCSYLLCLDHGCYVGPD